MTADGGAARGPFGTGSKSQHIAVRIDTGGARYVLRRKDGPAMGDKTLDAYVGREVGCDGVLPEHTLLAERIDIVK